MQADRSKQRLTQLGFDKPAEGTEAQAYVACQVLASPALPQTAKGSYGLVLPSSCAADEAFSSAADGLHLPEHRFCVTQSMSDPQHVAMSHLAHRERTGLARLPALPTTVYQKGPPAEQVCSK